MLNSTIKEQIISRRDNICKILEKEWLISEICMAVDMIINCIRNGNKVLIAGNGGSAADAQHIAAELVGRFKLERDGYPAIALTTNTSILTAIANDYGYENVFSRQIEALGKQGDIFIGISTSGNSKNIILACEEARKKDMKIIGMFGLNGKLTEYCDCGISIPSDKTPLIQEAHEMIYHIICEEVEINLSK
jgi:D-sedoheptulose 7-phosphate isomerase